LEVSSSTRTGAAVPESDPVRPLIAYQEATTVLAETPILPTDELVVQNPLGIHLRPAGHIVRVCSAFRSDIFFLRNGQEINAKSILGVIALAAEQGATIEVRAEGEDADAAIAALKELFARHFEE
jgi:phosphocarrier protein